MGKFDESRHFDELNYPLDTQEGVLSPSTRRSRALLNIFGGSADAGVTYTGPIGTGATPAGQITLDTAETTIAVGTADQLGRIDFKASSEASGSDAVLVAASIWAEAAADFTATANATDFVFALGVSEAAAEKLRLKSDGRLTVGGIQQTAVVVTNATTYAVLTANSGKPHLVPDMTATNTITLPAAAAGLNYEFRYVGAAADAQNWIIVPTAGFYIGGLLHTDVGGTTAAVYSNGSSNDVLTIVTPAAGTQIFFTSDGTNWYVTGVDSSATIATFADA